MTNVNQTHSVDQVYSDNFTTAPPAGNSVLLAVTAFSTAGATISSSAPQFGGAGVPGAVQVFAAQSSSANRVYAALWLLPAVGNGAATSYSITVTNGGTATTVGLHGLDIGGLGPAPVVDLNPAPATGTTGNPDTGTTAAAAFANELVVAIAVEFGVTLTIVGGAWNETLSHVNNDTYTAYQVVSGAGSTFRYNPAGTGADWVAGIASIAPATAGGVQSAVRPGRTWGRRFRHAQAGTGGTPSAVVAGLAAQVTVNAGTGSVVTSVPFAPQPLQPGPAWKRLFRHRQQPPAAAPAVTVAGLTAQVTVSAETGSVLTATPYAPLPSVPGRSWLRMFRHRQQDSGPQAPAGTSTTVTGLTAQVTVSAETGSVQTAVQYAPQPLQAGQTWARFFRHRQQATTAAPAVAVPGIAAQVAINAETGSVQTAVPYAPPASVPGQSWLRIFRHRQQDFGVQASAVATTTVSALAAQVTASAETGSVSTSVPFAPQPLQPGISWRRLFRHRQQASTAAPAATVAGLAAQVTINAETGAVQTATEPQSPPQAKPGRTWLRLFTHRQQSPGAAASAGTASPGTVTITNSSTPAVITNAAACGLIISHAAAAVQVSNAPGAGSSFYTATYTATYGAAGGSVTVTNAPAGTVTITSFPM